MRHKAGEICLYDFLAFGILANSVSFLDAMLTHRHIKKWTSFFKSACFQKYLPSPAIHRFDGCPLPLGEGV
jgi:hypothetical protein